MRKVLLTLLALGGAMGAGQQAHAGPAVGPRPVLEQQAQAVQFYDDWRYRQFRRREAFDARQRFREQRFLDRQFYGPRSGYDSGYGSGYGPRSGYGPPPGYYGPRYY